MYNHPLSPKLRTPSQLFFARGAHHPLTAVKERQLLKPTRAASSSMPLALLSSERLLLQVFFGEISCAVFVFWMVRPLAETCGRGLI
jgi:hypothetical protein